MDHSAGTTRRIGGNRHAFASQKIPSSANNSPNMAYVWRQRHRLISTIDGDREMKYGTKLGLLFGIGGTFLGLFFSVASLTWFLPSASPKQPLALQLDTSGP